MAGWLFSIKGHSDAGIIRRLTGRRAGDFVRPGAVEAKGRRWASAPPRVEAALRPKHGEPRPTPFTPDEVDAILIYQHLRIDGISHRRARRQVAAALGHGRISVLKHYLGSTGQTG